MLNRVILQGRLCANPEYKQTQSGVAVCRIRIAVNRPYRKDAEQQEADFFNCTAWRATADFLSKYFSKGSAIVIEGSIRNNNYTDNNGVKHYANDIQIDQIHFGESKNAASNSGNCATTEYAPQKTQQKPAQTQRTQSAPNDLAAGFDLSEFEEILSDGERPF